MLVSFEVGAAKEDRTRGDFVRWNNEIIKYVVVRKGPEKR